MSSTQPLPPPSPLCTVTNYIAAVISSHFPLSYSSGNWYGGGERGGGAAATTLSDLRSHPYPLGPLSPFFDPYPLRKLRHLFNALPWPDSFLLWLCQYPPLITCPKMTIFSTHSPLLLPISLTQSYLSLLYPVRAISLSICPQSLE